MKNEKIAGLEAVGWVEAYFADTHRFFITWPDGYRFAQPILRRNRSRNLRGIHM